MNVLSNPYHHPLTTSTTSTTTTTKRQDSKPFGGAVAKVTVAISAGPPSPAKPSPKAEGKSGKGKRSSSSSSSSGKGNVWAEQCRRPCEETSWDSSSDITLRRTPEAAPPAPTRQTSESVETFGSLFERSAVPKVQDYSIKPAENSTGELKCPPEAARTAEEEEEQPSLPVPEKAQEEEEEEWSPLVVPLGAPYANSDDAVGRNTAATTSAQPVKFCFTHQKSAGKGRPFSYADAAAGKEPTAF